MVLALRTGIAPSVWAEEGERAVATAFDLLDNSDDTDPGDDRVMSG